MKKLACLIFVLALMLSAVSVSAAEYTDKATVRQVQQALNDAGYDCGTPDGISGEKTQAAIDAYRAEKGLSATGVIDDELLTALRISGEKPAEAAEEAPDDSAEEKLEVMPSGLNTGKITGDFDEPALTHPEERYEFFFDETDGSEELIYMLLDRFNDEAEDIEEHGALYITEHQFLSDKGVPALNVKMSIQESPYGKVIIAETTILWMKVITYTISHYVFSYDGKAVEISEGFEEEAYADYCESYHFPYGSLKVLRGVRQDENGYNYFFMQSDEPYSIEFVVGEGMRILQLRVYEEDEDGVLTLHQYADYDVGPAWEIPQAVLDKMGEVLEPVEP